jgi:protoheme IX farnesyltransferase
MTPPTLTRSASVAVAASALTAEADALAPPIGLAAVAADCSRLVRPRIALMVLVTVLAALWLTAGADRLAPARVAVLLVGTALVAASSSIANQILERETDRLMPRTAQRPIAAGRLGVAAAWWITALTLAAGVALATAAFGWQPAAAALCTWVLYVVLYTPLKRRTPLNTAVGAVAGALPVAIGWLAADGPRRLAEGDVAATLAVAALGTVLYLWQFPHFMAIAWLYRRDYAAAGLRMLTVDDPSGLRAAGQSLAAALAMIPVSLVLAVPSGGIRLFLAAAVAAIVYAAAAVRFAIRRDDRSARSLLMVSIGTLLAVLSAAIAFPPVP